MKHNTHPERWAVWRALWACVSKCFPQEWA